MGRVMREGRCSMNTRDRSIVPRIRSIAARNRSIVPRNRSMDQANRSIPPHNRSKAIRGCAFATDRPAALNAATQPLYRAAYPLYRRAQPLYGPSQPLYHPVQPLYPATQPLNPARQPLIAPPTQPPKNRIFQSHDIMTKHYTNQKKSRFDV